MPGESTILRKVLKEVGKRGAKLASRKAASRILGKLATNSRAWRKAFEHISEHFAPVANKAAHAIFEKEFRSKAGVEGLLRSALNKLGRAPVVSKLTSDGIASGAPCVILEKEFDKVIGTIGDRPCKILRIIVDFTGKPITAFPVEKFVGTAGALAITFTAATSQADVPRVRAVEDAYTAEHDEAERRQDNACDRASGGTVGKIIDFLTFDSTCSGSDPAELISPGEVSDRANSVVAHIEAGTGISLDKDTQDSVREDVRQIWGWGTPGSE